jgi:hypothetical protein
LPPFIASLLAAVLSSSGAQSAPPDSPAVLFISGTVNIIAPSGRTQRMTLITVWHTGEVLRTSEDGRAQLRFSNGTLLSLAPRTHARLDAYRRYNGSGALGEMRLTVFRGSARLASSDALRISTPAAALTSPGAEVLVEVAMPRGIRVAVGAGRAELQNDAGRLPLEAGQRAFVQNRASAPVPAGTINPAPVSSPNP